MDNMPTTVTDLMVAAAKACGLYDCERLEELKAHVEGWLQTDEERNAQLEMLDAMLELVFESDVEYHMHCNNKETK